MPTHAPTPAGWHAEPGNPTLERYWDGRQWTPQTQPSQSETAGPHDEPKPRKHQPYKPSAMFVALLLLILVGFGAIYIHGKQSEDQTDRDFQTAYCVAYGADDPNC